MILKDPYVYQILAIHHIHIFSNRLLIHYVQKVFILNSKLIYEMGKDSWTYCIYMPLNRIIIVRTLFNYFIAVKKTIIYNKHRMY